MTIDWCTQTTNLMTFPENPPISPITWSFNCKAFRRFPCLITDTFPPTPPTISHLPPQNPESAHPVWPDRKWRGWSHSCRGARLVVGGWRTTNLNQLTNGIMRNFIIHSTRATVTYINPTFLKTTCGLRPLLKWNFVYFLCSLVHCLSATVVYTMSRLIYKSHMLPVQARRKQGRSTCWSNNNLQGLSRDKNAGNLASPMSARTAPLLSHSASSILGTLCHMFGACSRSITVPGRIRCNVFNFTPETWDDQ